MANINNKSENKIFISYAWENESQRIVNSLDEAISQKNFQVTIRAAKGLYYASPPIISTYQEYQSIILVISDIYLRSEYCMYEWIEIKKNPNLLQRVFPIILPDVQIYSPIGRQSYIQFWDERIEQLNNIIRQTSSLESIRSFTSELERYSEIRASFDSLIEFIINANTLSLEIKDDFSTLINRIESIMFKSQDSTDEVVKKTLHLKMDGKAFQDGIYIHTVVDTLKEIQYILDRSYLTISEGKNLMPKERMRYRLVAQEFRQGSFISPIDIVVAVSLIGPEKIWDYTKTTFEFLKFVYTLNQEKKAKKDETPITITGNNSTVNINHGEQSFVFNAPVLVMGENVLPSYKKLLQPMKLEEIDFLQLGSNENEPEIRLDKHDSRIFDVKPEILKTSVTIECEIFSFNKNTGRGKLRVTKKQGIPSGDYIFVIAKSRKSKNKKLDYVQSMLESKVVIECWKEILFDPFSPECTKIVKLHLLSVQALSPSPVAG